MNSWPRNRGLLFLIIIFAGLLLRLAGINFGLPYQFHQDEPIIVNHAMAYGTGDLNPHFFIIPPLASYFLFIFYGIFFFLGKLSGIFVSAEDFAFKFISDPTFFYLIARLVLGVIPGALLVAVTKKLYQKFFGEEGALYAAAVVAVSFLAITNSHYAYVDNLLVLFIIIGYLQFLRLIAKPSIGNYILSGVFLALAVGVKYNGALLWMSFLAAHICVIFGNPGDKKKKFLNINLLAVFLVFVAVFMISNPFSVMDWRFFLKDVTTRIRSGYIGFDHHIVYSLHEGLGWGVVILGFFGFIAIFLKEKLPKALFLISFPAIFYLHLVFKSQPFSRYVLPLIPFFAVFSSFLIFKELLPRFKSSFARGVIVIGSVVLLIPTTAKSIKADMLFCAQDTRVESKLWIENNLASSTKIAVDHASFRPQILQTKDQITEKYKFSGLQEGLKDLKEWRLSLLLKAVEDKKTYKVYFLTYKGIRSVHFTSMLPMIPYDLAYLRDNGIDYVVIDYNNFSKEKSDFLEKLKEDADIVKFFSPYYDNEVRALYDGIDKTCIPVGSKELFSRRAPGPALVIYKIRRHQ